MARPAHPARPARRRGTQDGAASRVAQRLPARSAALGDGKIGQDQVIFEDIRMNALQARLFEPVIAIHVSAALISVGLGLAILLRRKGTPVHRLQGRLWVGAMFAVAISSLLIEAHTMPLAIPQWPALARFGPIHLLSVITLITLWRGIRAIRAGKVRAHRLNMISLYTSLCIAGLFTLLPSRVLGAWLMAVFTWRG